jgi:hypothetical protein
MNYTTIDIITKPYWDEKFKDSNLTDFTYDKDSWNGLVIKRPDGTDKLIVGYPVGDTNEDTWYYDGNIFSGHHKLFNLEILEFNQSMVRYINEKYNLKVKCIF